MDKVIVIGCAVPGYAVIRALARRGLHLIAATYNDRDIAQVSRYVAEVAAIPRPEKDEAGFVQFFLQNASRWEGALLLESSDNSAVALSRNKARLAQHYRLVTPDWEILKLFVQKDQTCLLAEASQVPYPLSLPLTRWEDLEGAAGFPHPSILKPVNSFEFQYRFVAKNFPIRDHAELQQKFRLCLEAGQPMLLQEFIPGTDEQLVKLHGYVNSRGKLTGKFFYRKLRQKPPQFGVMRVGVSTERDQIVEELSEKLLQQAGYRGYFNTEFKRDPRDGCLRLIEVNCRMPRGGMLPTASGVNYPWLIYQDLIQDRQLEVDEYTRGLYWIEVSRDLPALFGRREATGGLRQYFAPYFARHHVFADLDFQDPGPFLRLGRQKLSDALRRARRGED